MDIGRKEEISRFVFEEENGNSPTYLYITDNDIYKHMKDINKIILQSVVLKVENKKNRDKISLEDRVWIKCNGINNTLFLESGWVVNVNFNNYKRINIQKVEIDGSIFKLNLKKFYFASGNCLKEFTIRKINFTVKIEHLKFLKYLYSSTIILNVYNSVTNAYTEEVQNINKMLYIYSIPNSIKSLIPQTRTIKLYKAPYGLNLFVFPNKILKEKVKNNFKKNLKRFKNDIKLINKKSI